MVEKYRLPPFCWAFPVVFSRAELLLVGVADAVAADATQIDQRFSPSGQPLVQNPGAPTGGLNSGSTPSYVEASTRFVAVMPSGE